MNLAYIISAYKSPLLLSRLVHKLNTDTASFFIHVDKKTDSAIFSEIKHLLNGLDNVYFLERHTCYWGGFGHVAATIKGIREVHQKKINYDYVILLTGQCYPVKSNQEIQRFFEKANNKSFLEYYPVGSNRKKRIERWYFHLFSRYYFTFPNKLMPLPIKRFNAKVHEPYYSGSSYWCLHKECIEYILHFTNSAAAKNKEFIDFFRTVYISDEFFFQTLLLNSPLSENIVNDNLRFIKWPPGHYVPSPSVLNQMDFDNIMSSEKLFARKFDLTQDSKILDMLDEAAETQN
jgi:hypothetical protein